MSAPAIVVQAVNEGVTEVIVAGSDLTSSVHADRSEDFDMNAKHCHERESETPSPSTVPSALPMTPSDSGAEDRVEIRVEVVVQETYNQPEPAVQNADVFIESWVTVDCSTRMQANLSSERLLAQLTNYPRTSMHPKDGQLSMFHINSPVNQS